MGEGLLWQSDVYSVGALIGSRTRLLSLLRMMSSYGGN